MDEFDLKPFGARLSELLAQYGLSAASASRARGHNSRTTLRRILLDQANIESMEKFLSEFLAAQILPLTAEEEQSLYQSLRISRFGVKEYRIRMEMNRLLTTPLYADSLRTIHLHNTQSDVNISLHQFFKHISSAQGVQLLIINSPPAAFFETLNKSLPSFSNVRLEIEHYLFLNDDLSRTVRFIAAALPMLGASCYSARVIPAGPSNQTIVHTLTSSIVVCCARFSDDRCAEYQLGFTGSLTGELLQVSHENGIYKFWQSMLTPSLPRCVPITSLSRKPGELRSYLSIAQSYLELEKNHAIYMIRSEIFPAFLPSDLLVQALKDCPQAQQWLHDTQSDLLLEGLFSIQQKRFDNIYHKKRVTHVLMSLQSLRTFIKTGELHASFLPMRPFTIAERRYVLTYLRDQSRDNPYFNLYFPKNDSAIMLDATCYDPVGVLMYHTALATEPQHVPHYADALIELPDFTALFAQYFRDVLLPHYALSFNASLSVLTALIDSLPDDEPPV